MYDVKCEMMYKCELNELYVCCVCCECRNNDVYVCDDVKYVMMCVMDIDEKCYMCDDV